jgi:hypothetical protein
MPPLRPLALLLWRAVAWVPLAPADALGELQAASNRRAEKGAISDAQRHNLLELANSRGRHWPRQQRNLDMSPTDPPPSWSSRARYRAVSESGQRKGNRRQLQLQGDEAPARVPEVAVYTHTTSAEKGSWTTTITGNLPSFARLRTGVSGSSPRSGLLSRPCGSCTATSARRQSRTTRTVCWAQRRRRCCPLRLRRLS